MTERVVRTSWCLLLVVRSIEVFKLQHLHDSPLFFIPSIGDGGDFAAAEPAHGLNRGLV